MRVVITALVCFIPLVCCQEADNKIDWDYYHRTETILDSLRDIALKHPGKARFEDIPDPDSKASLPLLTITDFAGGEIGKEVVLLVAGEHAREIITSEIALWLAALLADDKLEGLLTGDNLEFAEWPAVQPIQATAWRSGWTKGTLAEWAEELLKKVVFKIFPVQNIAGRKAVEHNQLCLRKTISGVDLNRNWPYAWVKSAPASDEHGGAAPFSEPETRIVRTVAAASRPQAFVNLHSGEWAMYVPWDSKSQEASTLPEDTGELLEKMNTYCQCMKGAAGKVAGYLAQGTSMDYMFDVQHVPYPLTFEVYGPNGLGKLANGGHPRRLWQVAGESDVEGARQDGGEGRRQGRRLGEEQPGECMPMFNPTSREGYQDTVASWVGSLLVLADHLTLHPHASSASHEAHQEQLPKPPPWKQDLARAALDGTVGEAAGGFSQGDEVSLDPIGRRGGASLAAAPVIRPLFLVYALLLAAGCAAAALLYSKSATWRNQAGGKAHRPTRR